jgi:hypothetical protein
MSPGISSIQGEKEKRNLDIRKYCKEGGSEGGGETARWVSERSSEGTPRDLNLYTLVPLRGLTDS